MSTNDTINERQAFSHRLKTALANAKLPASPTKLSRNFNARCNDSVTVHAARKWLVGEAIPTQVKVRALASMVGVDPNWLRFGLGNEQPATPAHAPEDLTIIHFFRQLDDKNKVIARDIMAALARHAA